ncbi:uncharacterized protein HaLaN_10731, partial [Haematococcus lacustris]
GRQPGQPGQGLGLGLLLHSQEYPAWHPDHFPHHLGWCQHGSDVRYQPGLFRMRNILWWAGSLAVLDTGDGSLWQDLRYPGALNTVDEGDCGRPLADVNFLPWPTAAGSLASHTALIPEPSCDEACAYGEESTWTRCSALRHKSSRLTKQPPGPQPSLQQSTPTMNTTTPIGPLRGDQAFLPVAQPNPNPIPYPGCCPALSMQAAGACGHCSRACG